MSFDWVSGLIKREPVLARLERMQPEMRALVTRLLERFAARDATPLPIADEGAALALWGTEKPDAFLAWHREQGGLARSLEVLLAAIAYRRQTFEWDRSVWTLRRARPAQGLFSFHFAPWVWLRTELAAAAPAERIAAGEVASRASRALVVRAAVAFTLPEVDELWTAADEAELRHADVDDHAAKGLGVLAMMRRAKLDHGRLARVWWELEDVIPAQAIVAELGERAVGPLRLVRAYDELARHANPDALRALAEFADVAWDALAQIKPTAASIAAIAPMFTTLRPRRVLGMQLARGLLAEFVVAAPAEAHQVARENPFVASIIAETGVALPDDDGWVSPWSAIAKPKAKPAKPKPIELPYTETIHWAADEREAATASSRERSAELDREMEHKVTNELKTGQVFVLFLRWMTDEPALRTWKAVDSKRWYARVDDIEHLLARFGLAELDSIIAYVQTKPDALAALARVESPRVAPLMARGFALLKKQQAVGRTWLDRFPEAAAIGLVGDDATDKKQRDANDKALAYLSKQHESVVGAVLARAGGAASTAQLVEADAPTLPARRPKLPPFIDVGRLPRPIRADGKAALAGEPLVELVQLLAATLPDGHPALDAIAARYTAESLGRFAWSLFRQWLFAKGPPKHKWALYAVGKFPDDDNARALGRLARVWAPQGNSSRAQEAVEALAMMRTQGGLVEIHDISRKVQSKALKARAEKVFETVAESLGLAPEELADRLIPELTEEDLTFGDLRVEFDATLTPRLVAPDGTSTTSLPGKPEPDDAKRWKELKRLCATVARGQLARLEQSMAEAHRMPFSHFAEIYLMHSLIRSISSSLLWGAYRDDKLDFAFAIDDGSAVDASGKPIELPVDARYGVVHPVELAEPERVKWATRFADQPFEQLARKVFAADDAEACQLALAKLRGRVVPTASLLGLSRSGWRRAEAEQRGRYYSMQRHGQGWFAELAFAPGIYLGSPTEEATQSLEAIVFRADGTPPRSILSDIQRDVVQLGQL